MPGESDCIVRELTASFDVATGRDGRTCRRSMNCDAAERATLSETEGCGGVEIGNCGSVREVVVAVAIKPCGFLNPRLFDAQLVEQERKYIRILRDPLIERR